MSQKKSKYSSRLELLRIKIIHQFLEKGGGTYEEMADFVNERLSEMGEKEIQQSALREAIKKFKNGEFEHHLSHLSKEKKATLFKIKSGKNFYKYAKDSKKPQFGDLDENERLSLPFLIGVLKQYEELPAFDTIISRLCDTFKLDNTEFQISSVVVVKKPKLINEEKIFKLVAEVVSHIKNQNKIEFTYLTVHKLKPEIIDYKTVIVSPLQIRLHENLFYLIGEDNSTNKIRNFRLDKILRFKVDVTLDEKKKVVSFDYKSLEKKYKLKTFFDNVLGVWCHNQAHKVYRITIKFRDWAASYIKCLPLHETQKIIFENEVSNSVIITIEIKLTSNENDSIKERAPELAFLLGRFREYCEIIKAQQL